MKSGKWRWKLKKSGEWKLKSWVMFIDTCNEYDRGELSIPYRFLQGKE